MKLHLTLLAISLLAACSSRGLVQGQGLATVYYIPFESETYLPVTTDTIEYMSTASWKTASFPMESNHENVRSSFEFDDHKIRAKISWQDRSIYVDSNGIGTDGSSFFSVSESELKESFRGYNIHPNKGYEGN